MQFFQKRWYYAQQETVRGITKEQFVAYPVGIEETILLRNSNKTIETETSIIDKERMVYINTLPWEWNDERNVKERILKADDTVEKNKKYEYGVIVKRDDKNYEDVTKRVYLLIIQPCLPLFNDMYFENLENNNNMYAQRTVGESKFFLKDVVDELQENNILDLYFDYSKILQDLETQLGVLLTINIPCKVETLNDDFLKALSYLNLIDIAVFKGDGPSLTKYFYNGTQTKSTKDVQKQISNLRRTIGVRQYSRQYAVIKMPKT